MPQASPPGKSGVSAIFPAIKHQERGPDNRITLLFVFSQEILLTKHDTCRICHPQTTKVIYVLSDRPLFTRPSLYLSLSSFPSIALENNALYSILNNQQWYTFLLLSSPFLDLPPFLYHHRYNSFIMFIFIRFNVLTGIILPRS